MIEWFLFRTANRSEENQTKHDEPDIGDSYQSTNNVINRQVTCIFLVYIILSSDSLQT